MRQTTIHSSCECQAGLHAELDEHLHVRRGWSSDPLRRTVEPAPALTIDPGAQSFSVGWSCPFCMRNILRRFDTAMLSWNETQSQGDTAPSPAD